MLQFANLPFVSSPYATDWGILILRLVVGALFLSHGIPKLRNREGMAKAMQWPSAAPLVLGLVETLSGAGLILGYYIRIAALALTAVMVGALYNKLFKWHTPFTAHDKTGWEFDLLLLATNLLIYLSGGGNLGIGL